MKDLSFVFGKEKEIDDLNQAKITAIDKVKGRVSLAMKNGLISTATYLHDINDLRVGMTVLVGKLNDSYFILEKVSANPKNSNGMSLVKFVGNNVWGFDYIKLTLNGTEVLNDHFDGSVLNANIWSDWFSKYHPIEEPFLSWQKLPVVNNSYLGFGPNINGIFANYSIGFPLSNDLEQFTFEISMQTGMLFSSIPTSVIMVGTPTDNIIIHNGVFIGKVDFKLIKESSLFSLYYKYGNMTEWQFKQSFDLLSLIPTGYKFVIVLAFIKVDDFFEDGTPLYLMELLLTYQETESFDLSTVIFGTALCNVESWFLA
jgi:hypothetical protein